jgi:hypothetical protein
MKTKLHLPFITMMSIALLLNSCSDDDPTLYQAYGIAFHVVGQAHNFCVITDRGDELIPSENRDDIDTVVRVFATFSFVNEEDNGNSIVDVKLEYLDELLYKEITDDSVSLGDAPIYVKEGNVWQSEFHDVLNIPFEYDGGAVTHLVNLYYNSELSNNDTVTLEFKHNDNADSYSKRLSGLVCFDLESINDYVTVTDSITYKVTFNKGMTDIYMDEFFGVYKSGNYLIE